MPFNRPLVEKIAKQSDYPNVEAFLEAECMDSVVPGICEICEETTDVEPDCDSGYCECCDSNSVKSPLVLMGFI